MVDRQFRSEITGILAKYDVVWQDADVVSDTNITFRVNGQPIIITYESPEDALLRLKAKLQEIGVRERTGKILNRDKYTVYRSARVIAIDCDQGLAVPQGNVLVIPLNQPNRLLDLTKEQFHILFSATTESAAGEPPPEPKVTPAPIFTEPNTENDLLRYLEKAREPQRAAVIASRLGISIKIAEEHLKTFHERGLAVVERGVWRSTSRPAPPPIASPGIRRKRSEIGVSPQLGRILAAMAIATKIAQSADLTTHQVKPYLSARDQHQYSARLPAAVEKGFVQKGSPLPESRGWHYQITTKGLEAVAQLGRWSYEQDEIPAPDWLEQLADAMV